MEFLHQTGLHFINFEFLRQIKANLFATNKCNHVKVFNSVATILSCIIKAESEKPVFNRVGNIN